MRPLRLRQLYIALGGSYLGAIVFFTLTSAPPQGPDIPNLDKWEHLLAYGLLMGWFGQLAAERRLRAGLALGFMALGGALELLQGMGGVRQAEWADAAANALGVWMGHWATRGGGGSLLEKMEAAFEKR